MKAVILTLLLLLSCTKYSPVSRGPGQIVIEDVQMSISRLEKVKWRVGKKKEKEITQSFTFVLDMPKIREADLTYMSENRGVDAWIIRLIKVRGSETQDLGSLYTLFKPLRKSRTTSSGPATSVSLKVYYAAAYASERFRNANCPAFDHNLKISSMEVRGEDTPISIIFGQSMNYQEKSQLIELTPSSFNGGNSLIGDYFLEIAPYDSKNKKIHAQFKRLPQYIHIEEEEKISIESCQGKSFQ